MFKATGSMPPKAEEEKKDAVPAAEPEINEPADDVPTPPAEIDDVLDEGLDEGLGSTAGVPDADTAAILEGEQDPLGPDPVIEPVKE